MRGGSVATVRLNEVEIAYRVRGSGDPVILIGGFTMVKESWGLQVKDLARHFRVITFDNRGVGETRLPDKPFTVSDMAGDTVGLMDGLGIEDAHVFGVSMGGLIAQTLVLDYPERVGSVVLGCTTHGGSHAVRPTQEVMEALGRATDPSVPVETAVRNWTPIMFSERFMQEEPDRLDEFIRFSVRNWPTPEGAVGQIRALSVFNARRRLGEIRCPVLAITGSEDLMMPPENARLLAQGIPGAEHYVVEGAGHGFFFEKPEEVNRVLIDFFKKSSAS
jgi:pimeloyl-ACP methyl ester carboxylesterase